MRTVRISKALYSEAREHGAAHGRNAIEEIEFYYTLGKLVDQYPDLPLEMLKSLQKSTLERASLVCESIEKNPG